MFGKFSDIFKDLGIDLAPQYACHSKDGGIVINEPSVVAVNTRIDQILRGKGHKGHVARLTHILITKP